MGPSRWPTLCSTRYGAIANTSPPASAAARGSPSSRSQAHANSPARHVDDELQHVPAGDEPEERAQRPEEKAERPAGIVRLRLGLGLEGVRIQPRGVAVLELVADEPVVVERLQMVARARPRRAYGAARQEVRVARVRTAGHVATTPAPRYSAAASATKPARREAARRSPAARPFRNAMRRGPYRPGRRGTPIVSRTSSMSAELVCDLERAHRVGVPVGEQREVQVERLRPGDVRPRRVAGDAERPDTRRLELLAPVTQELHLVRSGGRPVEEVEDEQRTAVHQQLLERASHLRRRPDGSPPEPCRLPPSPPTLLRDSGLDATRSHSRSRSRPRRCRGSR